MPCREPGSAPHLTSDSSARLFTTDGSTRSVKSQSDSNGAALLARADDRAARELAHALHGVQAEADLAADDGEVDLRLVHVGRQHLDPELVARVDVERHAVLRVHHRADQRGHVLARVVRAQPGGAVRDQRVAGGVRLVERVVLRLLHVVPELARDRRRASPFATAPSMNLSLSDAISAWIFLPIALRRSSASAGVKPPICLAISIDCSW